MPDFFIASGAVLACLAAAVLCEIATLFLMCASPVFRRLPVLLLPAFWISLGAFALVKWLDRLNPPISPCLFKTAAVCLYLFGAIMFIQAKSLLSRGYSLRVLVDLLQAGGCQTR